jgi:methyltransferase (TIGR00027 family)
MRAVDTMLPPDRRLVDDPAARHFITTRSYRARFATTGLARATARFFDWRYPGYMGIVLLRQRYWDEVLTNAVADGIDQVLLLGAGYDTTALRHRLEGIRVFEIDAPPTQERKKQIMQGAGLTPAGNVTWVGCDFERQSLAQRLTASGFDPQRRSVTVWYGVTFFITERAVRATLADLASVSAPGSLLVWDHIHRDVWDGTTAHVGAKRARAAMIKRGEPYRFGIDPEGANALVRDSGYVTVDQTSLPDLKRRLGGPAAVWCRTDDIVSIATACFRGPGST